MWENEKYDIVNGLLTMCSSSYSMQDVDDSTFTKKFTNRNARFHGLNKKLNWLMFQENIECIYASKWKIANT